MKYDTISSPLPRGGGRGEMINRVKNIKKGDLKGLLEMKSLDYQYVDVRTPGEFRSGKIKNFINLPLQSFHNAEHKLDKSKPVVLICATGARSRIAAGMLQRLKFKTIINVKNGMFG